MDASPGGLVVKTLPAKAGDAGGLSQEDPPGGGNGNLLQYLCRENPTDRGAWRATVRAVAKGRTRLSG